MEREVEACVEGDEESDDDLVYRLLFGFFEAKGRQGWSVDASASELTRRMCVRCVSGKDGFPRGTAREG